MGCFLYLKVVCILYKLPCDDYFVAYFILETIQLHEMIKIYPTQLFFARETNVKFLSSCQILTAVQIA